jgi:hypothetical protein
MSSGLSAADIGKSSDTAAVAVSAADVTFRRGFARRWEGDIVFVQRWQRNRSIIHQNQL